ncbi:MAG: hypothetical protein ICV71_00080 [Thermoleophilia bacterium]|nr:hypothetical protein [Thermoleophilia bacterium]MDQ3857515.1 hypothetical protein [Actinomycetota bacterium]
MEAKRAKVLVIAARQSDFAALLADDGFEVDVRTRPLEDFDGTDADVAVVFRGRLIGRKQASSLVEHGIPVIEVLTVEPPGTSTAGWIRLSNRIPKTDLVQIVHAVADAPAVGAAGREGTTAA